MGRDIITSDKVFGSGKAPTSKAVKVGNLIFVCGMPPFDVNRQVAKGDFQAQMRQCMDNIKAVLEAGGSSMDEVAKVTVFLARESDIPAMNEIYRTYFKEGNYPARTAIETKLQGDFLGEIECVAEA
ncbi:MAG: RidA family protein [Deltaproteobacteria bacterium]|nr:RidA family protein [Deltaproteobacteria bacterium]